MGILNISIKKRTFGPPQRWMLTRVLSGFLQCSRHGRSYPRCMGSLPHYRSITKKTPFGVMFLCMERVMGILNIRIKKRAFDPTQR
ncbi:hypothetical protein ABIE48_005024 [Paenibacillus sp. OAE614]